MPVNPFLAFTDVSAHNTVEEKLDAAGLLFEVGLVDDAAYVEGKWQLVPNQKHVLRLDTLEVIDRKTLSNNFRVLQNKDAFSWLDRLDRVGKLSIDRAASFEKGAKVCMLVRLENSSVLPDGSVVEHHVILANGHIGQQALTARPVNILRNPENPKSSKMLVSVGVDGMEVAQSIRHTKNMRSFLATAGAAFKQYVAIAENYTERTAILASTPCATEQAIKFFNSVFGDPSDIAKFVEKDGKQVKSSKHAIATNRLDKLKELFAAANGSNYWHAYKAVANYANFEATVRTSSKSTNTKDQQRLDSLLFNDGARLLDRAFFAAVTACS